MKWRWWIRDEEKPEDILTLDTLMKETLDRANQPSLLQLTIHPKPRADVIELTHRLGGTSADVIATGVNVLMAITEGGNREFTITRFGKQLRFRLLENVDGSKSSK